MHLALAVVACGSLLKQVEGEN